MTGGGSILMYNHHFILFFLYLFLPSFSLFFFYFRKPISPGLLCFFFFFTDAEYLLKLFTDNSFLLGLTGKRNIFTSSLSLSLSFFLSLSFSLSLPFFLSLSLSLFLSFFLSFSLALSHSHSFFLSLSLSLSLSFSLSLSLSLSHPLPIYLSISRFRMWNTLALLLLPGQLWTEVVVSIMVLSISQIDQSALLFTHSWRENNWIHTFPVGISAMWNATSLVQDLNSCRRVHFLRR